MLASKRPDVRCRLIEETISRPSIDCLRRGFPYRRRAYWVRAMARMAERPAIEGFPRYGYLLEAAGGVVGVILVIYSRHADAAGAGVRCNLSSWCVDKDFRGYALVLHADGGQARGRDLRQYFARRPYAARRSRRSVSSDFATARSSSRRFCRRAPRYSRRRALQPMRPNRRFCRKASARSLAEHAALGCRALVCVEDGVAYPFVFQRRAAFHRLVPCQQLIYCRSMDEFVRFAGSIGRYLLLRAWPIFLRRRQWARRRGWSANILPNTAPNISKARLRRDSAISPIPNS